MRKLSVYLLIAILIFSQNPLPITASVDEELEVIDVVLLSDEINEDIAGYSHIDSIETDIPEYSISDETEAILLNAEEIEVNGIQYSLISYKNDIESEDELVEAYVASMVVVLAEHAEEVKKDRLDNNVAEDEEVAKDEGEVEEPESETTTEEDTEKSDSENFEDTEVIEEELNTEEFEEDTSINMYSTQARTTIKEASTSKLGHIRNRNVRIYDKIGGSFVTAGTQYTNAVYYIKKQANQGKDVYYLISKNPSATSGVVGWVKAKDLSIHNHVGVDKHAKTVVIKGNGKATSKAWGGSKDNVHANLSKYKGANLIVNLTEKVGNNTWYRGKINGKGPNVWLHSSYVNVLKETNTSKLGHIRSGNVTIHETIGGKTFTAGSKYTNAVYYIKKQLKTGATTYYLISTSPSATSGVVGWVNAKDLSTHNHVGVDKKAKTVYLKGNGKTTTKAWGGKKDGVHSSLTNMKHQRLVVNLTEKVGNNTWYRGKLNGQGQNVWVHSSYVLTEQPSQSNTSRLGHIRHGNVKIYNRVGGTHFTAGSQYINAVYYIKRQARLGNDTYYLISSSPSATTGTVGWVNAKDLSTHAHVGVDKKSKIFYLKGNGKATNKAWGGSKNDIYPALTAQKGNLFEVNLTEKVGNNTWYRGKVNSKGQNVWVHSSYVTQLYENTTVYDVTYSRALDIQIAQKNYAGATHADVAYYLNPRHFIGDAKQKFQFLDLSKPNGIAAGNLNKTLINKGTLHNQGNAFSNASRTYGVNEVYLIAHAILETGHGSSTLASGVEVGKDSNGNLKRVTAANRKNLKEIKTTYNMFGIGAIDSDALNQGAITAYKNGWFTPSAAIIGGAKWIADKNTGYINNQHKQNTLYKMRWNPNMGNGYAWKQYATDVAWAYKQANIIYDIYTVIGFPSSMAFDYVNYK